MQKIILEPWAGQNVISACEQAFEIADRLMPEHREAVVLVFNDVHMRPAAFVNSLEMLDYYEKAMVK